MVVLLVYDPWYRRSGLVIRSPAHNRKLQVRFPLLPLVGYNLGATGAAYPPGSFFGPKLNSENARQRFFPRPDQRFLWIHTYSLIVSRTPLVWDTTLVLLVQRTQGYFTQKKY